MTFFFLVSHETASSNQQEATGKQRCGEWRRRVLALPRVECRQAARTEEGKAAG